MFYGVPLKMNYMITCIWFFFSHEEKYVYCNSRMVLCSYVALSDHMQCRTKYMDFRILVNVYLVRNMTSPCNGYFRRYFASMKNLQKK